MKRIVWATSSTNLQHHRILLLLFLFCRCKLKFIRYVIYCLHNIHPWLESRFEKNQSQTKKFYTHTPSPIHTHTFYRIDLGNYQWGKCVRTPPYMNMEDIYRQLIQNEENDGGKKMHRIIICWNIEEYIKDTEFLLFFACITNSNESRRILIKNCLLLSWSMWNLNSCNRSGKRGIFHTGNSTQWRFYRALSVTNWITGINLEPSNSSSIGSVSILFVWCGMNICLRINVFKEDFRLENVFANSFLIFFFNSIRLFMINFIRNCSGDSWTIFFTQALT